MDEPYTLIGTARHSMIVVGGILTPTHLVEDMLVNCQNRGALVRTTDGIKIIPNGLIQSHLWSFQHGGANEAQEG